MNPDSKKALRLLQEALDDFPKLVARQEKRARERKRFLKKTFGDLIRQLEKEKKKESS